MKILHVIANLAPRYGGASKACRDQARAMARRGHDVSILTTDQDGPYQLDVPTDRDIVEDGVRLRYFPIQLPRYWCTSWPLAKALETEIPAHDLIHMHSLYLFHNWTAGRICRRAGTPYIVQPHGTLDPFIHRRRRLRKMIAEIAFQNRVLRHAAAILYTAEEEKRLAEAYACGAPGLVVPLGLDLEDYDNPPAPGAFRTRHPEIGDKTIILFFGRLNFKKGLDLLIEAYAVIARARDDVHLVLAGPDGGMQGQVEMWLREQGVRNRATFTGMLLAEDKAAVLSDSDIFVLSSYSENFGISVIEAMAYGLPVVISNNVNIWPEVKAGGSGKITPCDAEEVARALFELLDDPGMARDMGKNGKNLVRERFSWPKIALMLEDVYSSLV